jgi:hypothetical protein
MTANPAPTPTPEDEIFPRHSASEAPVRRADRIAWQIWVACVLLTVALTLVFYLIDKISPIVKRWL